MNICVLDSASMGDDIDFKAFEKFGKVTVYESTTQNEITERIKDADVIITNKIKITQRFLEGAKKLKLVCVFATGYDNIDVNTARRLNVAVCNVPGYSTDSVTLMTVATVLSLVTHLNDYAGYVKSGEYSDSGVANRLVPVFHELRGKVWGLVGYGNIGKAVAKVALVFGMKVLVNKRSKIEEEGIECVDIDTLCERSDIISLHCPLNKETERLINRHRIGKMKRSVVLVNEARGAVVDEEAVCEAVLNKRIAAYGCDVYSQEPFGKTHPYYEIKDLPNVILTPHAAWAAYEARMRCLDTIASNIETFMDNRLQNRVDI